MDQLKIYFLLKMGDILLPGWFTKGYHVFADLFYWNLSVLSFWAANLMEIRRWVKLVPLPTI